VPPGSLSLVDVAVRLLVRSERSVRRCPWPMQRPPLSRLESSPGLCARPQTSVALEPGYPAFYILLPFSCALPAVLQLSPELPFPGSSLRRGWLGHALAWILPLCAGPPSE